MQASPLGQEKYPGELPTQVDAVLTAAQTCASGVIEAGCRAGEKGGAQSDHLGTTYGTPHTRYPSGHGASRPPSRPFVELKSVMERGTRGYVLLALEERLDGVQAGVVNGHRSKGAGA